MAFAKGRGDADCSFGAVGAVLLGRARTLQVLGAVRCEPMQASNRVALSKHQLVRCQFVCCRPFFPRFNFVVEGNCVDVVVLKNVT